MRLFTYIDQGKQKPGISLRGEKFDVSALMALYGHDDILSTREVVRCFGNDFDSLASLLKQPDSRPARIDTEGRPLSLVPPVTDPEKVLCVGLNYRDHVGETGRELPKYPDVFTKFARTLVGPYDDIDCSDVTSQLDFEGELAIVIGRETRKVDSTVAPSHIAGLTIMNDVTARDYQYRGTQFVLGKSVENSTPIGPEIVTLDEFDHVNELDLTTRLNGEVVQHSNTRHFIFDLGEIISYISQVVTLVPGDIIATGTPAGVGAKRNPPLWMRPGDQIEVEIEGIGAISSRIV